MLNIAKKDHRSKKWISFQPVLQDLKYSRPSVIWEPFVLFCTDWSRVFEVEGEFFFLLLLLSFFFTEVKWSQCGNTEGVFLSVKLLRSERKAEFSNEVEWLQRLVWQSPDLHRYSGVFTPLGQHSVTVRGDWLIKWSIYSVLMCVQECVWATMVSYSAGSLRSNLLVWRHLLKISNEWI